MNLRAKCVNKDCRAFGIEKSVMVGRLAATAPRTTASSVRPAGS